MEENKPLLITENESVKKTMDLLIEIKKLEEELSLLETCVKILISLSPRVAPLKTMTLAEALKEENIAQYKGKFVDTLPPQQRKRLIPIDFNPRECTSLKDYCEKATAIMGERIYSKPSNNKRTSKKKRKKDDTESLSDKKQSKKKKIVKEEIELFPSINQVTLNVVVDWASNFLVKCKTATKFTFESLIQIELIKFGSLSFLLREYPPRKSPLPLVEPKVHVPFKTNPEFVNQASYTFQSLSSANDKQNVFIPYLACGPGTGKSRTLQEIYQLTKYGIQNRENSCSILLSYGKGWDINDTERASLSYEEGLCMRIVFSYLGLTCTFSEFRNEKNYSKFKGCSLLGTLRLLAKHFNNHKNRDENEKVVFYIAIDEFTELQRFSLPRKIITMQGVAERTYLHEIIKTLGIFIADFNSKSNITLLPMFAGLDSSSFSNAVALSRYGAAYIAPYIYSSEDLYSIVQQYVPHLICNNELWKRLCFNRHAKSIEYFIEELQSYGNVKDLEESKIIFSFNQAKTKLLSKYTRVQIDKQVAQQIVALVLTETPVYDENSIVEDGPTFKELEDWGYIRLIPTKRVNEFICTSSLPMLEKCWSILDESKIFQDLFDKLFEEKPSTIDRPFEKLNGYFDLVLNQCFIYLGKDSMTISERFRGITTRDRLVFSNLFEFDLKTFPTSLKEIDLEKIQSIGQPPKNTMIQFSAHNTKFFDRYYNTYYTKNGDQHPLTFLWKERGLQTSFRKFTKSALSKIINEQFNKENITSINATVQNSFGIVFTTRPVSSVVKTIDTIGIIGREGLEQYYGSFIFKIMFCNGMPFPINQTFTNPKDVKKYSYQLAFLLGINDTIAKTLHDQILQGNYIRDLNDLESVKNPNVSLNKDLFNFSLPSHEYKSEQ